MGSAFNPQILVEKLAKLNSSQASIETLSHWCIFHMNKARQVVETWARQFHSSPREQRLAFLYLANDILQNSRRKGAEFVGEFWKVLPDALRDVIESGDEFGRNAAQRLINIWEERKVFGSRGQILKEEFVGRQLESNRNGKHLVVRPPAGTSLDKIVSDYQAIYGQTDEDTILRKCKNAINCLEKADKEVGGDFNSGQFQGAAFAEEVHGHHAILRDCIDQLTAVESSRATLVSHLKEALQEQEFKLNQLRNQLQAAHSQSEKASTFCRQLMSSSNNLQQTDQSSKEHHTSAAPHSFMAVGREQLAPVMYTQQVPFAGKSVHEEDPRKSAAAAVAAKLTASTDSAQMLSYVLSSLASEGVIQGSSGDYPSEKKLKLNNDDQLPYVSQSPNPSASSPFPHSESLQLNVSTTGQQYIHTELPPPPSSPPPLPPLPPVSQYPVSQYMQAPGPTTSVSFTYSVAQPQTSAVPGYTPVGAQLNGLQPLMPPANPYQNFQGPDGKFYSQQSSMQLAPMSRQ
ncbi:UPF0400 protein C337.03 [Argentina anserina]|uniref:UPF0400 protein C337.03 n=1 Tax=Argentina anserina TaxID=57926 RepID=UPI002176385D|nr:UPF0400 protein C337.03 [Potentilla anserina]